MDHPTDAPITNARARLEELSQDPRITPPLRRLMDAFERTTGEAMRATNIGQFHRAAVSLRLAKTQAIGIRAEFFNLDLEAEDVRLIERAAGRCGTMADAADQETPDWQKRNNPRPPGVPGPGPMRRYTCACCGAGFTTDLSPNPQRDTGYGHCTACRTDPRLARSWEKQKAEYVREGGSPTGTGHGCPVPWYA